MTRGRDEPYALNRDNGDVIDVGVKFIIKASEQALGSGSGSGVLEYVTRKGEEPSDHTHPTEDEMFYVVSGEISFRCAGQTFDLSDGGFVFLPRGVRHGYTIRGDEPVRLLVITSPVRDGATRGWEGFLGELEANAAGPAAG